MLRGLLLDFYGTLVEDDDEVMRAVAGQVAAGAGPPVTAGEVHAAWSRGYEAAAARPGFRSLRDCSIEGLRAVLDQLDCPGDAEELCSPQFAFWRSPPLRPGTRAFLDRLQLPVCLVSDADRSDLDAALAHHGLVLPAVVTSGDTGAYKPDPAVFERALMELGLRADEVLHVGDSLDADVRGAHAAHIGVVWINRHGRARPDDLPMISELPDLAGLADVVSTVRGTTR